MWNFKVLRKTMAVLFLLCMIPLGINAQAVKGTVSDEAGEPIIGATVKVQGTRNATITDFDGNFSISASQGATLDISYVGYEPQSVKVGRGLIKVTLKEDVTSLNDVVVIGYGVQKKSDLTGSVASLKGDDLKNLSTTDAGAAMQGKVTGVQIINSGAPGDAAEIRVRGYGSNGDNTPLLIVDGLKVDNIQYLDPSLIESMEILKDAASAAIYGAQAGNGVVLITTKQGAAGKTRINYTFRATANSLGKKAELFDANEYIEYHKYLGYITDASLEANAYKQGFVNTDWYDEVFEASWNTQHNLTVEGGNDKGHFLAGLGIVNHDGMVKGDKDVYKRFTAQVNADYKFNNWLQISSNTSVEKWSSKRLDNGYGNFLNSVVSIDPLTPAYIYDKSDFGLNILGHDNLMLPPGFEEGVNEYWYGTSKWIEDATANPLAQRDRMNRKNEGVNVRGTLAANITPLDCITFTSRLGYRIWQRNGHEYRSPYWLSSMAHNENYYIAANTNAGLYYQWENFLNFNKDFGKHNVGAMIGMSFTKRHWDDTSVSVEHNEPILEGDAAPNYRYIDFLNATGKEHQVSHNQPNDATELSYFGRLSYSYDNRYFFQFNIRRDAYDSSKLIKDKRWGTFPSVSAGWTISNEKFFKDAVPNDIVSFLKLRASWGRNGNVNILSGYKYASTVALGGYYQFNDNTATTTAAPSSPANPDLTWETAQQTDLGLDARFLNNRLSLGIDWYRKVTKDLLINIVPFPELGFASATVNSGEMLNTGFEFDLGWRDRIGDLKYSINANFSTLKNEMQKVNDVLQRQNYNISGFNNKLTTTLEAGHTMYYFRGYKYAGVNPETGQAQYYDKDGQITTAPQDADKQDLGSGIPKFTYGITLNLEYKGFDFTVFGTGAAGNKIYNLMVSADRPQINGINTYWKDSWKNPGDNSKYPDMKLVATDWDFFSSDAAIFSGNYFKFKQIQLGYTLPKQITRKFYCQALRLSVSLDDFFTITSYPGADPETSSTNSGELRGIDNGNYPMSKKVVLGVNVTF